MEQWIDTGGGKLYITRHNKDAGPTWLLIHGFMENQRVYNQLVASARVNTLCVDLMGFGKSTPHADFDFALRSQALAIKDALEQLEIHNPYIMGHSMGGYIALELIHHIKLQGVTLLHSTCRPDTEERKLNRNKTIAVLEKDPSLFIREFYWNLFATHRKQEFGELVEDLKIQAAAIDVRVIIETVKALRDRPDQYTTWEKFMGKKYMIAGSFDALIDYADQQVLANTCHADLFTLENSGHMGFYEEPDRLQTIFNQMIKQDGTYIG